MEILGCCPETSGVWTFLYAVAYNFIAYIDDSISLNIDLIHSSYILVLSVGHY